MELTILLFAHVITALRLWTLNARENLILIRFPPKGV